MTPDEAGRDAPGGAALDELGDYADLMWARHNLRARRTGTDGWLVFTPSGALLCSYADTPAFVAEWHLHLRRRKDNWPADEATR